MTSNTILILQGVLIALQIINVGLINVVPHNPVGEFVQLCVAAVVGGFQFIMQHIGNQTTPTGGKTNDSNGTKIVGMILLCLLAFALWPATVQAQTPNVAVAYMGANQDQIFGGGAYAKPVGGSVYWYSGYDVTRQPGQTMKVAGLSVPKLKFTQYTGFAMRLQIWGKLSLWTLGTGGLVTNGDVTGVAWGAGGFFHYPIKGKWGVIAGAQWLHDPITSNGYAVRAGPTYSWGGK